MGLFGYVQKSLGFKFKVLYC